jgi:hypothetical protein
MRNKLISLVLSVLLANFAASPVYSHSQNPDEARRIEKIKEGVRKLGTVGLRHASSSSFRMAEK